VSLVFKSRKIDFFIISIARRARVSIARKNGYLYEGRRKVGRIWKLQILEVLSPISRDN
jgi:hypothetical protein